MKRRDGASVSVRNDPLANAFPGQELIYGSIQRAWSAWARLRHRRAFEQVRTFALFVGYPRSGHSLVGAMLNAHRHAVISHELNVSKLFDAGCSRDIVYSRILFRAAWFNLRGNKSNYEYQIPHQWQGRFTELEVIGDKGGGWVALALQEQPDLLQRIRDTVRVPIRFIHVVRNPLDNIAAISTWHRLSLDESIDYYFSLCGTIARLPMEPGRVEMITVYHEDFVRAPEATLSTLCSFLELETDAGYLRDCSSIVFEQPTESRRRIAWPPSQVKEVDRRRKQYDFLQRYELA